MWPRGRGAVSRRIVGGRLPGARRGTRVFPAHAHASVQRPRTGSRPGDQRPLAALGRFRAGVGRAAQGAAHAGVQDGDRHHPQGRDRQRQRPAVAHHLGDPVGHWRRPHHGVRQLAAALRNGPGRRRRSGRRARQGGRRLLRRLQAGRHGRQQVDRRAVDDRRRHPGVPSFRRPAAARRWHCLVACPRPPLYQRIPAGAYASRPAVTRASAGRAP